MNYANLFEAIRPRVDFVRRMFNRYLPSGFQESAQEKIPNTIDLLFGNQQVSATLDGELLKVEIRITPPAIELLRALYKAREKDLDSQLYEAVNSAFEQLKKRIEKGEINPIELWGYLLGKQPIAKLPPGDYLPSRYDSIRVDEQGKIYFNGINISIIGLKSKPQ